MHTIDLRSDTVTKPSEEMRRAMANAKVGDDVFDEDPSINELQKKAAKMMRKEAALLVPSGTMANLVAILNHSARGEEIILGNKSHTFFYEGGGISRFGGITPHILPNQPDGTILIDDIEDAIRADNIHFPRTSLICLENTHNKMSGTPIKPSYMTKVREIADENNLPIHIDGARIFNAARALDLDVSELAKDVDSLCFCLSKGLGCPVGSLIIGDEEFIHKAKYIRKALGGGMRQAGIIAAAGIYALDNMVERLDEDHKNALKLAKGIAEINGLDINLDRVSTDIVYFDLIREDMDGCQLVDEMAKKGILFFDVSLKRFRMVTHFGIEESDIDQTLEALKAVLN